MVTMVPIEAIRDKDWSLTDTIKYCEEYRQVTPEDIQEAIDFLMLVQQTTPVHKKQGKLCLE